MSCIVLLRGPTVDHKEAHSVLLHTRTHAFQCFPGLQTLGLHTPEPRPRHVSHLLQGVGLQDLGYRHGEAERLTEVHVLLLQSHQTAAEQVLVLLQTPRINVAV